MSAPLSPPPPRVLVPPRPDIAPPPLPSRRRRRWPIVVVAALLVVPVVAQLGVSVWPAHQEQTAGVHAFLGRSPDGPYRWNPCQPIHYEVNLDNAPAGAIDDVRAAIA